MKGVSKRIIIIAVVFLLFFLISYEKIRSVPELSSNIEIGLIFGILYMMVASLARMKLDRRAWSILRIFSYISTLLLLVLAVNYSKMLSLAHPYTYMTIGYIALPSAVYFAIDMVENRNIFSILALVVNFLFLLLYGSRFPVLIVILAIGWGLLAIHTRVKDKAVFVLVSLGLVVTIFFFIGKPSIDSRTVNLIRSRDFFYDSGRNEFYSEALRIIKRNPLVGVGMGVDRIIISEQFPYGVVVGSYPHNILLELGAQYGIVVGSTMFFAVLYRLMITMKSMDNAARKIMIYLVLGLTLELLVSSSYTSSPLSWAFLGLCF